VKRENLPAVRSACRWAVVITAAAAVGAALHAQSSPALEQELRRIFQANEYAPESFGPAVWFDDGATYGVVERAEQTRVLVGYDAATGRREVLADAALLTAAGVSAPLSVSNYAWTPDRKRALISTNTKRVWRQNTRGDYWLLDRGAKTLKKIGGSAPASSLMFAKLSPAELHVPLSRRLQGRRVGRAGARSAALRHDLPERYMGVLQDNAEGYRIGSPINFADGLKGKLLVVTSSSTCSRDRKAHRRRRSSKARAWRARPTDAASYCRLTVRTSMTAPAVVSGCAWNRTVT